MENALIKMKYPLTKIGIIHSVKLKNALGNIDNPVGKMENRLSRNEKTAR
jgi:hypothetical protein